MLNTNVMQPPAIITGVNSIAERLKLARDLSGHTQESLAGAAGVSQGTIGNIESDKRRNPRELLAIAKALGVRAEWLKDGAGDMRARSDNTDIESPNNKSAFSPFVLHHVGDTNLTRAPVIEWARLGTELFTESRLVEAAEYIDTPPGGSSQCKWFVVDESIPAFRIKRGYKLALDPDLSGHVFVNDDIYLFRDLDGAMLLAEYRKLSDGGFEAVTASGRVLDSGKHGLEVAAIHRGTWK